jgi:hypothetical protein
VLPADADRHPTPSKDFGTVCIGCAGLYEHQGFGNRERRLAYGFGIIRAHHKDHLAKRLAISKHRMRQEPSRFKQN